MSDRQTISAGDDHTLIVNSDGQVLFCGANKLPHQIGSLDEGEILIPTPVPELPPIRDVATKTHASAVDINNRVWALARNGARMLTTVPPIKSISAGRNYYLFLGYDGNVYSTGKNDLGQLGLGDFERHVGIFAIPDLPPIKVIAAGYNHNLLIDNLDRVWGFGQNNFDGGSNNYPNPFLIKDLPLMKDISVGEHHSLCLDLNGHVWTFGRNANGQLGSDNFVTRFIPRQIRSLYNNLPLFSRISAGADFSLALGVDGKVWAFGSNDAGKLGLNMNLNDDIPRALPIEGLPPIIEISAGRRHSVLLDETGQIWTCGDNVSGQLGLGDTFIRTVPTIIPNVQGKLHQEVVDYSNISSIYSNILTVYPIIEAMGVNDFRIISTQDDDSIMEFDTPHGTYIAQAQFDHATDQHSQPLNTNEDKYYDLLESLIKNNKLTTFEMRPDLYTDEKGNQGFEFVDTRGQIYLIRAQVVDGQIFQPL